MEPERLFDHIEDWTKIDLDNAKFILDEARVYVAFTIDVGDKVTDKAFKIVSLLFPIESALIAFLVNEKMKGTIQDYTIANLLLFDVFALVIVMFYLGKIVLPRFFMPKGREPKELNMNLELLGFDVDKNSSQLAIVLNEIENCQGKIDFNNKQNSQRVAGLKLSMLALGTIVVISIITLFIHFFM